MQNGVLMKSVPENKETYANQLKKTTNMPVILRLKNKQESIVTEKEIKEKIKPSSISVQVNGLTKRSDGVVAIKCQNTEERNILSKEIKEKMGNDYEVQLPKMKKPKILIVGMQEELEKDTIIKAIKNQNKINCKYLECVKVYRSPKNPNIFNAIIETDGDGFDQIKRKAKLNIEWDRCPVYESCQVLRCFKCWGFNHTSKHCKSEVQVCAKCSEIGHSYKECRNNVLGCINCVNAKERLNLDLDINHDSRNSECRILQRKNKLEAERVAY